jgi:hypothetical protein
MDDDQTVLLHFEDGRTQRMPPSTLDRLFLVDCATIRRFDRVQQSRHYVEVGMRAPFNVSPELTRSGKVDL